MWRAKKSRGDCRRPVFLGSESSVFDGDVENFLHFLCMKKVDLFVDKLSFDNFPSKSPKWSRLVRLKTRCYRFLFTEESIVDALEGQMKNNAILEYSLNKILCR